MPLFLYGRECKSISFLGFLPLHTTHQIRSRSSSQSVISLKASNANEIVFDRDRVDSVRVAYAAALLYFLFHGSFFYPCISMHLDSTRLDRYSCDPAPVWQFPKRVPLTLKVYASSYVTISNKKQTICVFLERLVKAHRVALWRRRLPIHRVHPIMFRNLNIIIVWNSSAKTNRGVGILSQISANVFQSIHVSDTRSNTETTESHNTPAVPMSKRQSEIDHCKAPSTDMYLRIPSESRKSLVSTSG
jgi:hypothetical protein